MGARVRELVELNGGKLGAEAQNSQRRKQTGNKYFATNGVTRITKNRVFDEMR